MDEQAWALISGLLKDALAIEGGKFAPNFTGHTGAFTGVMTAPDGRQVFVKYAARNIVFAQEALKREIAAHRWLPDIAVKSTRLLADRVDATGMVAVFGVIRDPAVVRWTDRTLRAATDQLVMTSQALRFADAPIGLPDAGARLANVIANTDSPWLPMVNEFTDMAFEDEFCDDICHSDLHRGNVMVSGSGEVTLIDWSWACRMPAVFDAVMLAADAALDGFRVQQVAKMTEADPEAFRLALGTYAALLDTLPPSAALASTRARKTALVTESLRRTGLIRS